MSSLLILGSNTTFAMTAGEKTANNYIFTEKEIDTVFQKVYNISGLQDDVTVEVIDMSTPCSEDMSGPHCRENPNHKTELYTIYVRHNAGPGYTLVISLASLRAYNGNEDWLAAALGHELTHIINKDLLNNARHKFCHKSDANHNQCEKDADINGVKLANKAGYNGCAAISYWEYWESIFGSVRDSSGSAHPSSESTISYLKKECKVG